MAYSNMNDMLRCAGEKGYAVPAFNIVNELSARTIVNVAKELKAPVILQTSVSTVKQIGPEALISFLKEIARGATVPVAIHLDHCTDSSLARRCIDLGWSSVMIDASERPLNDNIKVTREIVEYAHSKSVSVEGELGAIGGVEDNISVMEGKTYLATVEGSIRFVKETQVDAFAPAVGTAHGQYKKEPKLDFDRFKQIRAAINTPLVVHGGTGLADEAFRKFIELGASKINISTALKIAYCSSIHDFIAEHPQNEDPLKLDAHTELSITRMCTTIFKLFGADGRA